MKAEFTSMNEITTGLLSQLPSPPPGKTGWPWTEQASPDIYRAIDWPKLSIITPSYNQGQFIEETIRSILLQNYPNLEYIIIDGGSTDNTVEIIKKYDQWITSWESKKDNGQSDAINKGFKKYTGEIFAWLNSDDTYLEGMVRRAIEYLMSHPETGIVYGDSLLTESDGTPTEKTRDQRPFSYFDFVENCENCIVQPSSFIRRKVIDKVKELNPIYYYIMDWDFWLRAGLYFKIEYIAELISTYRLHAESKTVAQSVTAAPELENMYNNFFSRTDIPKAIRNVEKKSMMNMFFTSAEYYLNGNERKNAVKMANKAIRINPAGLFSIQVLKKYFYCHLTGPK
jgi:glycosyltransferase involved in cell wall biosynthesis